jgi:uncharacterized protein (TIGR02302 family)
MFAKMNRFGDNPLSRKLKLAAAALAFERLWSAGFYAVMVAGVLLLLLLLGVLASLPAWAKLPALIGFAAAFLVALFPFVRFRWPSRADALRRLEVHSHLFHRPLVALHDELAGGSPAPVSAFLWQEHRRRLAASLGALKIGLPRSDWIARDPYALRNGLAIALIALIVLKGGDWKSELKASLAPPRSSGVAVTLDAWITPPNYTGKAPVLLTSPETLRQLEATGEIVVPENSALIVRFNNARSPGLKLAKPLEDGAAGETIQEPKLTQKPGASVHEAKVTLDRPVTVEASESGRDLHTWRISLIPDTPPVAEIAGDIGATASGATSVPWTAGDDYGVVSLSARFRLSDEQEDGEGLAADGVFLFDPPDFNVQLPKAAARTSEGKAIQDLTAHPWAGLMVELTLLARDQAGQTGESKVKRFKLPERRFIKPLARSLVELRRELVMRPDDRDQVIHLLDALTIWPDGVLDDSGVYLGLRTVLNRLYRARSHEDVKDTIEFMWEMALAIEEGDVPEALRDLEAARKALEQALAEGAPPDRIAELMQKLREALDRYLSAMMDQARRNQQANQSQRPEPGQMVDAQDLNRMLEAIEELARSGAHEAAQELLSRLAEILSNLQPGMAQQGQQGDMPPMGQMLEQLGEILRRQQELMDDTFQLPQGETGEMGDMGEMGQGEQNGNEQGQGRTGRPGSPGALAQQQDELSRMLEQLMQQLGQNGMEQPGALGRAQENMDGASGALRRTERNRALGEQGEAMDNLRQGAEAMARQMMQQGNGQQGNYGRHGEARGDDRDPLGRPLPSRGEDFGPERDMLPDEAAIERAREILEYLRNRANDAGRPRIELDYFERLLRGLY